jgi:hypothetical protein
MRLFAQAAQGKTVMFDREDLKVLGRLDRAREVQLFPLNRYRAVRAFRTVLPAFPTGSAAEDRLCISGKERGSSRRPHMCCP